MLGKNGSGAPAYARAGWQRGQCAISVSGKRDQHATEAHAAYTKTGMPG